MAFVLVAIVASATIRFFKAIFVLIFRLLLSIVTTFWALARNLFSVTWVIVLLIALVIFGVGVLFVEFQEETQTSVDAIYECGVFPAGEIGFSFFHFVWRRPYEFFATQWNDLMIFIYDSLGQIFEDIQNLVEIKRLYKEAKVLDQVTEEVFSFTQGISAVIKAVFRLIRDTAVRIGEVIVCVQDLFVRFLTAVALQISFINEGCTYCAMDPLANGDTEFNCTLRNAVLDRPEPDCMQCNNFLADGFECVGRVFNVITFGFIEDKLPRIMRAMACVIGSMFKPPAVIFSGLIDNLITDNCMGFNDLDDTLEQWFLSEDCGKPDPGTNCELPGEFCKDCTDLPIGVIPCFTEFLRAITDDEFDDFFELIFSFIFSFIQIIIDSIVGIRDCFVDEEFKDCLDNFPTCNVCEPDAGYCEYDFDDTQFEFIVPDKGIHECFALLSACLDDEENIVLLQPLFDIGLMQFLFDDFWRFTVDMATCPFAILIDCFDETDCDAGDFAFPLQFLNPPICIFDCVAEGVPPFSFVAEFARDALIDLGESDVIQWVVDLVDLVTDTIRALIEVWECWRECTTRRDFIIFFTITNITSGFFNCMTGNEPTCPVDDKSLKHEFELNESLVDPEVWNAFWVDNNVYNDTMCGEVLHSMNPNEVDLTDPFKYSLYWGCMGVASAVLPLKNKCSPELIDVGALYSFNSLPQAFSALLDCEHEIRHNRNDTLKTMEKASDLIQKHGPDIKGAVRSINLYSGVLTRLWKRFEKSPFYSLTNEFIDRWQDINYQYSGNETGIILRSKFDSNKEQQQKELYMLYVNAFLWNYRSRFSPGSFHRKSKELALPEVSSLQEFQGIPRDHKYITFQDLESKKAVALDLYQNTKSWKEDAPQTFSVLGKIYSTVHRRFNFDESPWVQSIEAVVHAIKTQNFGDYLKWAKNEKGFLYEEGFVEVDHYDRKIVQNRRDLNNSLIGYVNGMYEPRRPRKLNLMPRDDHITFWSEDISTVIASVRDERVKKRAELKEQGFSRTMRGTLEEGFDANQKLFDFVDKILVKLGIDGSLNALYEKLKVNWDGSTFESFVNKTRDFLEDYITCAIPENIDGTDIYSPWCLNLLPEHFFRFFALVPTEFFPVQVPWPEDLIREPCVTTYNGNNDLFEFEFSNNCDLENDTFADQRILCDFPIPCDLCLKEYRACGTAFCRFQNDSSLNADEMCDVLGGTQNGNGLCDVDGELLSLGEQCDRLNGEFQTGFGDILDSLFYLLAAIPRLLDFLITGGIELRLVETISNLRLGVLFVITVATSPLFLLLNFFKDGLEIQFSLWTIAVLFGDEVPIGLLLVIFLTRTLRRRPDFSMYLLFLYIVLIVLIVLWIVSLFTDFPNLVETLNFVGWILTALEWIQSFPLFFWLNLNPLILRLERFDFGTGPIPPLENFCFAWTFGNFGLLILVVFFGVFLARLLYIWLLALWIFILEIYLILFQTYQRLRNLNTRNRVDTLEDEPIPEQGRQIQQLQKQIDTLEKKLTPGPKTRVGDVVIDVREEPKRPRQLGVLGSTFGRVLRKRDSSPEKKKK